jgi:hypothetical protein
VFLTLFIGWREAPQGHAASTTNQTSSRPSITALGILPLSFEESSNPEKRDFDFLSHGSGATFFLNYSGVNMRLGGSAKNSASHFGERIQSAKTRPQIQPAALQLKFLGANPRSKIVRKGLLPGKSNYLIGSDPKQWRTNISSYAKVMYLDIYPGIDVSYYGDHRQLEYDFVVKAGANPSSVEIEVIHADKIRIDASGNVKVNIGGSEIEQRRPFAYQEIQGVGRPVPARYILKGTNKIGLDIGNYDSSRPLIIDPVLFYSTYVGGSGSDQGISVALDSADKAYITGITTSADFPVSSGAAQVSSTNGSNLFITKMNATGTGVVYSTYVGGSGTDEGLGIAVDTAGRAYVTGLTDSADFPVTAGAFQSSLGGGTDAFIVKLNPLGTGLIYSTYLGGNLNDEGYGIAVDVDDNAYVTGVTDSANYPTPSGFQTVKKAGSDAFLSKMSSSGSALSYSTFLGGDGADLGLAVTTDTSGNAYVAGATNSSNFPATINSYQAALASSGDGFVAKLDSSQTGANSLSYATYLGGSGFDLCDAVALDEAGNAYVTGLTDSPNFPTTAQAPQGTSGGNVDAFVSKLNATGSTLVFSTYLGGNGPDWGRGIALEAGGRVHVGGSTESINFPIAQALQTSSAGKSDAFIVNLDPASTSLGYASYLGGTSADDGLGIATDLAGNDFTVGNTISSNLVVSAGAFQSTASAGGDAFLAKVSHLDEAQHTNHIDDVSFFVRQHYFDFLNRAPDASGLSFWIDQIQSCGSDLQCAEVRHVNVSAAFFLSIEFQQTGYLVYRFNKASYNRMPRYELFLPDVQEISRGVVVLAPGWEQLLESNKQAFANDWVTRPEFRTIYDSKSNANYVDTLFANAGVVPSAGDRTALINGLNAGTQTRATVLRLVAENDVLQHQEFNRAFVLMQYFGYLRRNPDDPPDGNLNGFNFWLNKLNQFNGSFINAEMVKAFISSSEYRGRFGP